MIVGGPIHAAERRIVKIGHLFQCRLNTGPKAISPRVSQAGGSPEAVALIAVRVADRELVVGIGVEAETGGVAERNMLLDELRLRLQHEA